MDDFLIVDKNESFHWGVNFIGPETIIEIIEVI